MNTKTKITKHNNNKKKKLALAGVVVGSASAGAALAGGTSLLYQKIRDRRRQKKKENEKEEVKQDNDKKNEKEMEILLFTNTILPSYQFTLNFLLNNNHDIEKVILRDGEDSLLFEIKMSDILGYKNIYDVDIESVNLSVYKSEMKKGKTIYIYEKIEKEEKYWWPYPYTKYTQEMDRTENNMIYKIDELSMPLNLGIIELVNVKLDFGLNINTEEKTGIITIKYPSKWEWQKKMNVTKPKELQLKLYKSENNEWLVQDNKENIINNIEFKFNNTIQLEKILILTYSKFIQCVGTELELIPLHQIKK